MVGPGETLGSPWPPLAIRLCSARVYPGPEGLSNGPEFRETLYESFVKFLNRKGCLALRWRHGTWIGIAAKWRRKGKRKTFG
jgi:hypothetical protein